MQIKLPRYYPDRVAKKIFTKESYGSKGEIKIVFIEYCNDRDLLTTGPYILWHDSFKGMEDCFVNGRISAHHIWKIIKYHFKVKYA